MKYELRVAYPNELYHHGIKGQKWGVRKYQNPDGSLTSAGKKRYYKENKQRHKTLQNSIFKSEQNASKRFSESEEGMNTAKQINENRQKQRSANIDDATMKQLEQEEKKLIQKRTAARDKYISNQLIKEYGEQKLKEFTADQYSKRYWDKTPTDRGERAAEQLMNKLQTLSYDDIYKEYKPLKVSL